MKLILLDGGSASGKNTLGNLLVENFLKLGNKAILMDLDNYVEDINPSWIWKNKQVEKKDQSKARENYAKDINKYLQKDFTIIVIGERFLSKNNLFVFMRRIKVLCTVFLYHLSIPFSLRKERLQKRGSHSLIDIEKDQKDRDNIKVWPGYIYQNINSPEIDVNNLMNLIQDGKGMIDTTTNLSAK